jgi:hypothetical protein
MNALTPHERDEAEPIGTNMPDGSLLITPDQLARLGAGDAKRGKRELRLILAAERDHTIHNGPTVRPPSVRIAGPADEKPLFDLLMLDLNESARDVAVISEERVLAHIRAGTRRKGGIVGVIDGPGVPVAVTILLPYQWWWSNSHYIQEVVTFVHPDHRRSRHINDLIDFGRWVTEQWSKSFGYKLFMLCGVLGTKRVREKAILYRRRFAQVGAAFLYPSPFDLEEK